MARRHHAPQAGVLNSPPDHLLMAALDLTATDPGEVRETLEAMRTLVQGELHSDLAGETPGTSKDVSPPESGELGFSDGYDRYHLTITVGLASTAFDKLGIAAEDHPQDLRPIPWDKLGATPDNVANGDLVVQVCSDSVYINEHVLRRIERDLAGKVQLVWTVSGHQRHTSRRGHVNRNEGRALIGFLDGTSNLDPRDNADDQPLVFVDPAKVGDYPPQVPPMSAGAPSPYGGPVLPQFPADLQAPPTREPDWVAGGTYMVVRTSTIDTAAWDQTGLGTQEHFVGRWKFSGNALDQPDDNSVPTDDPVFANDPDGAVTPLDAHIRKANPRGPEDAARRIYRRGFPLITTTPTGLQRGLVFVCFGRTITTQFEFIERGWLSNPDFPRPGAGVDQLRQFDHVLSGGYFFVPALQRAREPWSWILPE